MQMWQHDILKKIKCQRLMVGTVYIKFKTNNLMNTYVQDGRKKGVIGAMSGIDILLL